MAVTVYFLRSTIGEHIHVTGVVGLLFSFFFFFQRLCDTTMGQSEQAIFCRQWDDNWGRALHRGVWEWEGVCLTASKRCDRTCDGNCNDKDLMIVLDGPLCILALILALSNFNFLWARYLS